MSSTRWSTSWASSAARSPISIQRSTKTGHIQTYLFGALGGAIIFVILQYVIR
jgi:hypothetical protein